MSTSICSSCASKTLGIIRKVLLRAMTALPLLRKQSVRNESNERKESIFIEIQKDVVKVVIRVNRNKKCDLSKRKEMYLVPCASPDFLRLNLVDLIFYLQLVFLDSCQSLSSINKREARNYL